MFEFNILELFVSHNIVLTAIMAFGLGIWVYTDRRRDVRNLTLSALLVCVSLWSFALVLWNQSHADWQADFWLRTAFFIGSFLPPIFLLFAYAIYRQQLPKLRYQLLLLLPNVFFLWGLYGQSLLLNRLGGGDPIGGYLRPVLSVHFALLAVIALGLLMFASYRQDKDIGLDRSRLAAVVVGTIISFDVVFAGMYSKSVLEANHVVWISNIALLVGMFIIAAAMVQQRTLVDLRLVSMEVFVLVALSVIVADLVVAENLLDFTLRLAILILLIFYGIVTVRSIIRETRRLHRMDELMEEVTRVNGRLLEADRTKTQFVSLASHQLRAPLGGMRNYLQMLIAGDFGRLNKKQKEILKTNESALTQALETIETFLNVAKAEAGKLELYRSECDMVKLADRVVATFQSLAEKKGLNLSSNLPSDLPPAYGDSGKLYHVLANLIDNAIKYTDSGQIDIYGWQEHDRVQIEVKDTGDGLDANEKEQLFKVFSRGLSGVRLNSDGSGLGLFIVRKIVQAHGGEVSVQSDGKGKGSRFGFTLPLYKGQ